MSAMARDGRGAWASVGGATKPRAMRCRVTFRRATCDMHHALLLLLLAAAGRASPANFTDTVIDDAVLVGNDTIIAGNETFIIGNDTIIEMDGQEPVVRKKRTFGDIVFRGLADVLGYNVARKPPAAFPPPLAPVPGIDTPLQAAPAAPAAPPPCGAPRAAAPLPCRAQQPPPPPPPPPKPRPPPPCPKPRAAPRPKPRPPPPPPPPPPCAKPRANPTTPSPCAPPPPPVKQDPALETISSNFQLNFNINRNRPTPAPVPAADDQDDEFEQVAPIAIEPRAARLPAPQQRKPRVYVDAFIVRNGITQRVDTVNADQFAPRQGAADDDFIAYDDEQDASDEEDYEDVQESRDKAVRQFGSAVDTFWGGKTKKKKTLPTNHYQNVHFGDRDLADQYRRRSDESHQNLQRARARPNQLTPDPNDTEEEYEATTTTEDPHRKLRPRVLPPTEQNPGQIDTVTVRVPPIYREKRPKKLHRRPGREDSNEENDEANNFDEQGYETDSDGENSAPAPQSEKPKRKRRRKLNRKTRATESTEEGDDPFSAADYNYYGKKLPISEEEKFFRQLIVPEPTKDADLARIEDGSESGHFLDDHERLREDPERIGDGERIDDKGRADNSGRIDDSGRSEEKERLVDDPERADERQRADSSERSDVLSPNAQVRETGYKNNYVHATNVRVDDARPSRSFKST